MTKTMRIFILLVLSMSILFTGCVAWDPLLPYSGESGSLMAVAVHSIPGVRSYAEDQLLIIDQDDYGRILFATLLTGSWMIKDSYNECILSLLVVQRTDDSFSYIYSENNYLITSLNKVVPLTIDLINQHFPEKTVLALKQNNDWNIAPEDAVATTICVPNIVEKNHSLSSKAKRAVTEKIGTNIREEFFRCDQTGNSLYFILNVYGESSKYEWYLIMLDESGCLIDEESAFLRLDNIEMADIPSTIATFMSNNAWDESTH